MLLIDKSKFTQLYGKNIDYSLFTTTPCSETELIETYLPSKLWRLNNLYKIVNKHGDLVTFNMNTSQHIVYATSLEWYRIIILKSRQQGISTFWLVSFFDDAITMNNIEAGLMAQGLAEAATLLKRITLAYDMFPEAIGAFFALSKTKDRTDEITFGSTRATIFIRTSFRSATLQRLHISEYGKIANDNPKRALETKSGSLQTIAPGNTVVIESTAEGDNDYKNTWDNAVDSETALERRMAACTHNTPIAKVKRFSDSTNIQSSCQCADRSPKSFKPIFLSWLDDPDCTSSFSEVPTVEQAAYFKQIEDTTDRVITSEQKNFWIDQYRELGKRTYQEYPSTPDEAFAAVNEGNYYRSLYNEWIVDKEHILPKLYDSNLVTHVAMDLGWNDTFVLIYFQRYKDEWRIVNEYTNSGEALSHYVDHINDTGYDIKHVVCPHDIQVHELGTGVTREQILYDLGVSDIIVLDKQSVFDGIEAVRQAIPNIWIDESCEYIQKCFKNYTKEWDDKTVSWKQSPLHNQYSHGADDLRYMVQSGVTAEQVNTRSRRAKGATL